MDSPITLVEVTNVLFGGLGLISLTEKRVEMSPIEATFEPLHHYYGTVVGGGEQR